MAISVKLSTGLRNHIATVGSAMAALQNGFIDVYGGAEPATADADVTGLTRLMRFSLGGAGAGLPLVLAGDGVFGKSASDGWSGAGDANGVPAWFRHVGPADTRVLSTTEPRIQGNIDLAAAALVLTELSVAIGVTISIDEYAITIPAANI